MEKSSYGNLGLKVNRRIRENRDEDIFTLKDFIEKKWILNSDDDLRKSFKRELKSILLKEDLFELVKSFFELENDLTLILDQVDFEVTFFNFESFYKNLSPLILRSIMEHSGSSDSFLVLQSVKESIRIGLEEELYRFEDKY